MTHQPDQTNSQGLLFTVIVGAIATLAFGIAAIALYRYAMNDVESKNWSAHQPEVRTFEAQQAADRGDIEGAMSEVLQEHQTGKY